MNDLKIFSGPANPALTQDICRYLNLPMGKISLGRFPDGEISCKIDEDVRGRDVFIVQSTCPPVNEHILELLVMIDSFKRASSFRITAVIPYFGYARQDRKDSGRVPITAKLVANLITRAGADRVLAMDLHAAQIQGFFDVPVDHLYAAPVLNNHLSSLEIPKDDIVVVSADEGGIKRALGHAIFKAVTHLHEFDLGRELRHKRVVDAGLHIKAVGTDAGLAGVAVFAGHGAFDGAVNVGVVKHDEGGIAAQLQGQLFDAGG
jgi:ribose-phosphate pyrophosphokinase